MKMIIESTHITDDIQRHDKQIEIYYKSGHLGNNYYMHIGAKNALENVQLRAQPMGNINDKSN